MTDIINFYTMFGSRNMHNMLLFTYDYFVIIRAARLGRASSGVSLRVSLETQSRQVLEYVKRDYFL